jgi:hypothetical protein
MRIQLGGGDRGRQLLAAGNVAFRGGELTLEKQRTGQRLRARIACLPEMALRADAVRDARLGSAKFDDDFA